MFDKNAFKTAFHSWATAHTNATPQEAHAFCLQLMPTAFLNRYNWLITESVRWFEYVQERRQGEEELALGKAHAQSTDLC